MATSSETREKYSLYHTLNQNLPSKKFPVKQKKSLVSRYGTLDEASREAFLMLICEHARIHDDYAYSPYSGNLPYGGSQKGQDVIFPFEKLPHELRWILSRFLDVVCK